MALWVVFFVSFWSIDLELILSSPNGLNQKMQFLVKSEVMWGDVVGNVILFNTFVKVVYIFQGSIWLFLQASMSVS